MVVAAEFTSRCSRCGGYISTRVLRPERFACVYCGWRDYGKDAEVSQGEGRVLRLRYLGERSVDAAAKMGEIAELELSHP